MRMEQEATRAQYPTTDLTSVFTGPELAYLEAHNRATVALQIKYIKNAIYLAKNPGAWKTDCYEEVLIKSYEWCEFFRVYAKPRGQG